MSLIIAIGNYIGINQLGITPPYGGEDIITETGVQMVSETGSQDLITGTNHTLNNLQAWGKACNGGTNTNDKIIQ